MPLVTNAEKKETSNERVGVAYPLNEEERKVLPTKLRRELSG